MQVVTGRMRRVYLWRYIASSNRTKPQGKWTLATGETLRARGSATTDIRVVVVMRTPAVIRHGMRRAWRQRRGDGTWYMSAVNDETVVRSGGVRRGGR
jgi:hypothetical protein